MNKPISSSGKEPQQSRWFSRFMRPHHVEYWTRTRCQCGRFNVDEIHPGPVETVMDDPYPAAGMWRDYGRTNKGRIY